MMYYLARFDIR